MRVYALPAVNHNTYGSAGRTWMKDDSPRLGQSMQSSAAQSLTAALKAVNFPSGDGSQSNLNNALSQNTSEWLSGLMQTMPATTAAYAGGASPTSAGLSDISSMADLYSFAKDYTYGSTTNMWASIDANSDGVWDKSELTAYADAYQQVFGEAIDVDDLLGKYGTVQSDGTTVMTYAGQNAAYQDDALGLSNVKSALLAADNKGLASGTQKLPGESSLNAFIKDYTYGNGKYASIDKNEDGVWDRDELNAYAKAYKKLTGVEIDVDAFMAKYGTTQADGTVAVNYFGQNEAYKDDALGLSYLRDAVDYYKAKGETGTAKKDEFDIKDWLKDIQGSMFSKTSFSSFAKSIATYVQKQSLLDFFNGLYFARSSYWNPYSVGYMNGYMNGYMYGGGMFNSFT